jgi:hypothetical protein
LCVEVPELVKKLREQFPEKDEKTIIPGDEIEVDFTSGVIHWRGAAFAFPALGSVPQSLVIAQGVENLVAQRLMSWKEEKAVSADFRLSARSSRSSAERD